MPKQSLINDENDKKISNMIKFFDKIVFNKFYTKNIRFCSCIIKGESHRDIINVSAFLIILLKRVLQT